MLGAGKLFLTKTAVLSYKQLGLTDARRSSAEQLSSTGRSGQKLQGRRRPAGGKESGRSTLQP